MAEAEMKIKKKVKSIRTYMILINLALLVSSITSRYGTYNYGFFLVLILFGVLFGVVKPITNYIEDKKEGLVKFNYLRVITIGLSIIYLILVIFVYYKARTEYPLRFNKLYELYNIVLIGFYPYLILCFIRLMWRQNKLQKMEGKTWEERLIYLGIFSMFVLFFAGFTLLENIKPLRMLDLSNIKTPSNISLNQYVNNVYKGRVKDNFERGIKITDEKFVGLLREELSGQRVENIRYLDLMNYNMLHPMTGSYYMLFLNSEPNEAPILYTAKNEEVRILKITIYNDSAILKAFIMNNNNTVSEEYRIKLSEEFLKQVKMR